MFNPFGDFTNEIFRPPKRCARASFGIGLALQWVDIAKCGFLDWYLQHFRKPSVNTGCQYVNFTGGGAEHHFVPLVFGLTHFTAMH